MLGFLLDAKIRKATDGAKSLDDVMRLAMQRYGGREGLHAAGIPADGARGRGHGLRHVVARRLDTTEGARLLGGVGLVRPALPSGRRCVRPRATLGLDYASRRRPPARLAGAARHAGFGAGINVDDEIVAIGDFRVRPDAWAASMDRYQPGQRISVLVARRDQLMRLDATFGREPADSGGWRSARMRPRSSGSI